MVEMDFLLVLVVGDLFIESKICMLSISWASTTLKLETNLHNVKTLKLEAKFYA